MKNNPCIAVNLQGCLTILSHYLNLKKLKFVECLVAYFEYLPFKFNGEETDIIIKRIREYNNSLPFDNFELLFRYFNGENVDMDVIKEDFKNRVKWERANKNITLINYNFIFYIYL